LLGGKGIIYLDWLSPRDVQRYFVAADLAVFPGTHSVLWEEAAGLGLPLVVKRWVGIEHIDVGGNCFFFENGTTEEIASTLSALIGSRHTLAKAKEKASAVSANYFAYTEIGRKAIRE
jgi:1,2-diacylglycerol 3-alpha-glucosyltransferase